MKERPILFSAPMVRALIADAKTQTRRIMKPQPVWNEARQHWERDSRQGAAVWSGPLPQAAALLGLREECPYGVPGDRLWVKETWYCDHVFYGDHLRSCGGCVDCQHTNKDREAEWRSHTYYRADGDPDFEGEKPSWKPSIHMFRWASRITLEIAAVRVERLQEISEEDAKAEGAPMCVGGHGPISDRDLMAEPGYWSPFLYRNGYEDLWESINGPGSWEANPWVWVISFRRVAP